MKYLTYHRRPISNSHNETLDQGGRKAFWTFFAVLTLGLLLVGLLLLAATTIWQPPGPASPQIGMEDVLLSTKEVSTI